MFVALHIHSKTQTCCKDFLDRDLTHTPAVLARNNPFSEGTLIAPFGFDSVLVQIVKCEQ